MDVKTCYCCKQTKLISEFGKDNRSKDGLNGCCRACKRSFNAMYRAKPGVKERHTEYCRERRKTLPTAKEYDRKRASEYRKNHPESSYKSSANYRARKYNCVGIITESDIAECLDFFGHRCAYSGRPLGDSYHLDHVVPLSKGGENSIHNIVPCLPEINGAKATHDFEEWYGTHTTFDVIRYNKIKEWMKKGGA